MRIKSNRIWEESTLTVWAFWVLLVEVRVVKLQVRLVVVVVGERGVRILALAAVRSR